MNIPKLDPLQAALVASDKLSKVSLLAQRQAVELKEVQSVSLEPPILFMAAV